MVLRVEHMVACKLAHECKRKREGKKGETGRQRRRTRERQPVIAKVRNGLRVGFFFLFFLAFFAKRSFWVFIFGANKETPS